MCQEQFDQRMIDLMSVYRVPMGPISTTWLGDGQETYKVTSLGPVVDFVQSLPEYEREEGASG